SSGVFPSGNRAFLQHVLGSGEIAPGWPAQGLRLSSEFALSVTPKMISDGVGGVLLAWSVAQAGLRAQHLTFDGQVVPGWPSAGVVVPTQHVAGLRRVASDIAGGLYIGWDEYNATIPGGTGTSDVFAQHVTAGGVIGQGWQAAGLQLTDLPGSTQW